MGPSSPCESTLDCLPRLKIDPLGLAGWLLGQFLQTCLLALLIPRSALHNREALTRCNFVSLWWCMVMKLMIRL